MENQAAQFLADAIRAHRAPYCGTAVDDPRDAALYEALITYETWIDHGGDRDDFLAQATAFVRAT